MKSPSLRSKKEQAALLIRDGQPGAAKGLLEEIARSDRHDADTWYMLAAVNHGLGIRNEAALCYEKTIALNPVHPEAHYYLGNLRGENEDHEGAIRCYRKALQLRPLFADAARNLGAILQSLGRTQEAIECYQGLLEQGSASADVYFNLGNAHTDLGAYERAIACYRRALELDPRRSDVHINLGIALDQWGELDAAVLQYEKALSVDPGSIPACRCLGAALAEQGNPEEAMARYRQALSLAPDDGLKLRLALTLPVIAESLEDLSRWRARLEAEVARLYEEPLNLSEPAKEVAATNFYLSYHGLNNRELHIKVAKVYERACPSLLWTAPHCAKPAPRSGKLRVAFISSYMHNHSIGKTTRGVLANLQREEFEVVSLFVAPFREDETSGFIRRSSDRSVVLPRSLAAARRDIAELKLDILFYQDIGMDPFTYFLAFSRLAPVQCLSFGHPDTTGIANMDYFISNDRFEPADSSRHYSERVFLLRDLGTLAYYYRPRPPDVLKRREDFGLPADANLYLCPQTLFKVHPEFDAILTGILRADPRGRLALIRSKTARWAELLAARLRKAMPDVADRIVFLPQQDSPGFLNLLAVCDVMLDTIHFNGMNTSLEGFSMGTPIVTLPTEFQRGRHTAGMYRKMGFTECVAADRDDYVRIAVKLGTEGDYRRYARDEILRRNEVLFEDMQVVREFERCFLETSKEWK
jgi:predicted O-linked N-acetylglucosamine transferase (SPINDLY family)